MLNLQERAHFSLEEFRKGRGSNRYGSEPQSPTDDDELAVLGGKTRLVKKEPSSPSPQLLDRSPVSNNPVIPFIMNDDTTMDPNLREYLQSFGTYNQDVPSGSQTSFSDPENSPISIYGMTPMTSPTFHDPSSGFVSHSPTQSTHVGVSESTSGPYAPLSNGTSSTFPQYFPVYDYGATSMTNGYSSASVPMLDMQPGPQRRGSGSPEGNNIHSTWNDFVNGLGMN
jgi:hypothetical protein